MITGPTTEAKRDPTYQKQYDSIQTTTSTSSTNKNNTSSSSSSSGSSYTIGSTTGQNIAQSLIKNPGSSTTVSDGSTWTSDADGNVWVTKDGVTTKATITGTSSSSSTTAGSGSSSASGISLASQDEKKTLVEQATSGSKKYGLDFQSTANQKIDAAYAAYSNRKQELIDQATSNDVKVNVKEDKVKQAAARQAAQDISAYLPKTADGNIVYPALVKTGLAESLQYKAGATITKKQSEEVQKQIDALEEEQADVHGRDVIFDESGKATNVRSASEIQKEIEALQEQKTQLEQSSVLLRARAALAGLDSRTTELLAQVNRGNGQTGGEIPQWKLKKDAKAELKKLGYSDAQIKSLAEYEQRLKDYEDYEQRVQTLQEFADGGLLNKASATAASVLMSPLKAIGNIESIRGVLPASLGGYQNADMPTNIFSPLYGASQGSAILRSSVMQNMSPIGRFAYQIGTSMLDSAMNSAVSSGLIGATGLTGEAAKNAIENTMSLVVGSEIAADSVYQGIQEGKSNAVALIDGIVEGAIEGFTEKYSVGDILESMLAGDTFWQRLRNAAIAEGGEEWASNWLNRAYDVISKQDKSEVVKAYNAYRDEGKTPIQAMGALVGDFAAEDTVSFLAGGLSGMGMSATFTGMNAIGGRYLDPTATATDQAILDALRGVQTPESATQTRQATAMDNAILQAFNQNKNTSANVNENVTQAEAAQDTIVKEDGREIVKQLQRNIPTLSGEESVAQLTGAEFQKGKRKLTEQVGDFFRSLGNSVFRKGLGDVILDERGVKSDIGHGIGRAKAITFAAVPNVIESGTQIDFQQNWKGRGYDTYVFAAPVDIGNNRTYVAAVVRSDAQNRLYLHEVIDADGNLIYKIENAPAAIKTGVTAQDGITGTAEAFRENPQDTEYNVSASGNPVHNAQSDLPQGSSNQTVTPPTTTVNAQNQVSRNFVQNDGAANNVSGVLQSAREQYGTIPAGENPVREVSLPTSVDGKTKVGRFARTAAEAQITTDEMVGRIEQMVADGKLDHEVYSNKQAIRDGAKQIEHEYARGKSVEQIRSEFIRDANNGKAGAKFVSQGTTLYADAIAEGNYQAASDILVALTAVETNAGQTVQAARLMKSMTPEGRIFTVQKMVSNLEGQINQRRGANNQIELNVPDALLEAYQNATTQQAQQAALDNIYQNIADQIPATLREGLQQWRYFSMLFNPSTHAKNIAGNVSGAIAKIGKDNLAALGEMLIIGDKEGRTKALLNPMSKADQNLLNLGWADYDNAVELFEDSTGKYNQAAGEINDRSRYWKINDPQNALTRGMDKALGGLEKVSDFNSKALEVEDMWFSKPMYTVALAGYMKANHLTEVTDAARTYAMTEAKRGTYNDINKVSKWATNLGSGSKLGRFLAGTIYPFKKVPANVMVRTVEYSPLGYLKGAYDLVQMQKGNPDVTVAQTIDDFAAATTGTALMGVGALLAKHGILRATGVGDEEEKEQQKNAFGAKDFSILVGDTYIPIDSLTLTGTGLLTGAQIWEAAQNAINGDTPISFEDFLDALSKITDPVFEQSMLSGLDSILSTLQNSGDAGTGEIMSKLGIQILGNYIGQYVPSVVGRVASSLDKNQRSTYLEPDGAWSPVQSAVQSVQQKIPGLREQMAVRYGNWGVPVEGNGANGVGEAVFNAVTPIYPSKQKTDPVEEEIARLHDANAEYSNFYEKPKKSIAVDGETVKLTSEQYARYIETSGQTDYHIRAAMLESDLYQGVSDKVKSEAMTLSEQYANALGKEAAGVGYESDDKWINELKGKSEEEIANALIAKAVESTGYLSEESQKRLDTVKNLYDSGAYMGVSSELLDSAKEKAEEYFKEAEQAKYGGKLSEEKQALEGMNQKNLAEYFLEQAANAKFKDANDDGTRMDEILDAYQDGEISEKLAMSMLGDQVVDAYADFGKEAGVTAEMVLQTANAYARMETEKDIDDVVTLSIEAQLDDWLDEQNWTDKQKQALRLGYYTSKVDSYNNLVKKLENGSITVGEAKKSLTSKYQSAWTHEVSQTGVEMQDYIKAITVFEDAPSADERDAMGFGSKWQWYCNELNKTDLTAEQKFAVVNAMDDYAEKTQAKIAKAVNASYVETGTGSGGGSGSGSVVSYGSGSGSGSGGTSSTKSKIEIAYERFGKNVGVTESMMQQAKDAKESMFDIVDLDGNTVRSTEEQFDAWLAKQSWTEDQKEAVRLGFYTDSVKNLQWLSSNLRAGNISVAEAKFELSPTLQTGWSKNVLESGASMADYLDAVAVFKQAPTADERKALGYSSKWEWWCDKLNETSMTSEQKYAVAISVQDYADSTKKKIAKKLGWTGKKEDATTSKTSTTSSAGNDAFWAELERRLGASLTSAADSARSTAETAKVADGSEDFLEELTRRLGASATQAQSEPEETYQIRTDEGYRQYLNVLSGKEDEYTASDGTVWTKGEDGEVYATKNGKSMKAEAVFDRADATGDSDSEPEDGYTVNTPAGKLAYQMLKNGVLTEWDASDGWTWKRTEDGIIAVKKNMRLPVRLAG